MFTRLRMAMGLALAALLVTSITVFAKGGFDFITITGAGLGEAVQIADASLTEDFFTFANFSEDKTSAPADPGRGYEITRHYKQGASDVIFDRLHYYPETGYVFYDGIENGESEYDGEWYTANPNIKSVFESALTVSPEAVRPVERQQPVNSAPSSKMADTPLPFSLTLVFVLAAGLAGLFAFAFWRRKPSAQQ